MRSSENRLESGCRRPPRLGASTLRWKANLGPKDAPGGGLDLRTRSAATAAKVILPRTPSKTLFGSRLLPAFSASLGDYFLVVVDKFKHDSSCEARARFRCESQPEALPVATLNLLVPD